MPSTTANNIQGGLQVYAFESLPAFATDLPPLNTFVADFSPLVAGEGQSVTTTVPTTVFGSLNDLSNGWESQSLTSSAVTMTLKTWGHDHKIGVTEMDTIGSAKIISTFGNIVGKQVANGLTVKVYNNITSSVYTNTVTINSSSAFVYAAPTGSLTYLNAQLDILEVPRTGRYAILNPVALQAMKASNNLFQTLTFGNSSIVQNGGYTGANGQVSNSAGTGLFVDGTDIYMSPRLTGASLPLGGDKYGNTDKLIGFIGNKVGLAVAARASNAFANYPGAIAYNATEKTSGWPFLFVAFLDGSVPAWRFGVYTLMGSAAGNVNGIIPILTSSN